MPQWSQLVRFVAVEDGAIHWGEPEDGGDVGLAYEEGRRIRARLLASGDPLVGDGSLADAPSLTVARLLAPVPQATMGTTMVRELDRVPRGRGICRSARHARLTRHDRAIADS